MLLSRQKALAAFALAATAGVNAIELDINSSDSIIQASNTIVKDILALYTANGTGPSTPGLLPRPYYWWEAGLMFDSLINYWGLSGDDSVVDIIRDGLLFQVGPDNDFMPPNQTKSEGNDDQSFWALAAMTAAERDFPTRSNQNLSWLSLAQNVFDSQVPRWDRSTCNGGLRWQIYSFNNGYNYKNTVSNGNFMQLSARLWHYTGNTTYALWAQKAYEWSVNSGLVEQVGGNIYVYDGADVVYNCSQVNSILWTESAGTYLEAMTFLGNSSGNSSTSRVNTTSEEHTTSQGLFNGIIATFTDNSTGVLSETACASENNCNVDQLAFRAILARALGDLRGYSTAVSASAITPLLQKSAQGAAAQCSGGDSGTTCGIDWSSSTWDGTSGLGQELSALEIILANLPKKPLVTSAAASSGGTSANGTSSSPTGSAAGASGSSSGSPTATTSGASLTPSTNTNAASSLGVFSISSSVVVLGCLLAFL